MVHGAQTPINNTEHANALGCCNDGLENCVCQISPDVITLNNKQFGQCEENLASTLLSTDYKEPQVVCYDNQTRARNPLPTGDAACTLQAAMGEGGNNVPLIQCYKADSLVEYPTAMITGDHDNRPTDLTNLVQECYVKTGRAKSSDDCETYADTGVAPTVNCFDGGDKRANELVIENICYAVDRRNQTVDAEVSNTLNTCSGGDNYNTVMSYDCYNQADCGDIARTLSTEHHGTNLNVIAKQECFAIDSVNSNSMKSANPHSGFHKEEIAKTLDTTDPNPTKNQGGNVIVSSINCQGGSNINVNDNITDTLTAATNSSGNNLCGVIAFEPGIAKRDGADSRFTEELSSTLRSNAGDNQVAAVIAIDGDKMGKAERKGGSGMGVSENEVMYTQTAKDVHAVCTKGNGDAFESDVHTSLSAAGGGQAGQGYPCARISSTVRRLLPIECERLMGFPDNHTRIPWKGLPAEQCPDSPRYKACGNSMCVNVMQWIGEQIQKVEDKHNV